MNAKLSGKEKFNQIWFFFPFQLVLLHFKRNHFLLFFWFILFGIINRWFLTKYGVHNLFLSPEYMGKSDFFAFGFLGFALGGFIMAFHLYTYSLHGFRFRFLLSVSRPFFKFFLNNFIIPFSFLVNYWILSYYNQMKAEPESVWTVWSNLGSFTLGVLIFCGITFLYFLNTNKDALTFWSSKEASLALREEKIESTLKRHGKVWRVETYINFPLKISQARNIRYYTDEIIIQVMRQNYMNGSIFELITLVSFFFIGAFLDIKWVSIPAGASILLLFTTIFMLISAFFSWFKGWSTTVILGGLVIFQILSLQFDLLQANGHLAGVNYQVLPTPYPPVNPNAATIQTDYDRQLASLEKWRTKNQLMHPGKPKLVLVNCSGGGLRSSIWSYSILTELNQLTRHKFSDQTFIISGSSGGLLGASLYREQLLREHLDGDSINPQHGLEMISRDLLNPIAASMVMRDHLFRFQKYDFGPYEYTKDRGYAFDRQFNLNTEYNLSHNLGYYTKFVESAVIPGIIMAPTVTNDGRRILISSVPLRHFSQGSAFGNTDSTLIGDDFDIRQVLGNQNIDQLSFISALRASASFPYILPNIHLPTSPPIYLMDAGIRDNFGLLSSLRFLYIFNDWIAENTSGVVIVQVRDHPKKEKVKHSSPSLFSKLQRPVGAVYDNLFRTQNYQQEQLIQFTKGWLKADLEVIPFELLTNSGEKISLNFSLDTWSKKQIQQALHGESVMQSFDRVSEALRPKKTESTVAVDSVAH